MFLELLFIIILSQKIIRKSPEEKDKDSKSALLETSDLNRHNLLHVFFVKYLKYKGRHASSYFLLPLCSSFNILSLFVHKKASHKYVVKLIIGLVNKREWMNDMIDLSTSYNDMFQ